MDHPESRGRSLKRCWKGTDTSPPPTLPPQPPSLRLLLTHAECIPPLFPWDQHIHLLKMDCQGCELKALRAPLLYLPPLLMSSPPCLPRGSAHSPAQDGLPRMRAEGSARRDQAA